MKEQQELFPGGFTYRAGPGCFPLSTDTMLLSHFVRLPKAARVADLGSGSGALGLLLCGMWADCTVDGLEIQEPPHLAALGNISDNGLGERLTSTLCSVTEAREHFPAGAFHAAVSNPPYFTGGPGASVARKEQEASLEDFFTCAQWLLRYGGDFFLVHRPERLADLMAFGRSHSLEPKQLRFVRHRPEAEPSLVLLQCRKGAKPGLKLLPDLVLHHADGTPTPEYRQIYHLP